MLFSECKGNKKSINKEHKYRKNTKIKKAVTLLEQRLLFFTSAEKLLRIVP